MKKYTKEIIITVLALGLGYFAFFKNLPSKEEVVPTTDSAIVVAPIVDTTKVVTAVDTLAKELDVKSIK